jgi:PAS domain-containing protein
MVAASSDSAPRKSPDFRTLFEGAPAAVLVLDRDLRIVAVTEEYLQATMTQREEIVGRTIFDVFPDNPEDLNATGVANLSASLQRVLATGARDKMPIQKYDIPSPGSDRFEPRYWAPENRPVMGDDGRVAFILHCVRNVTDRVMQAARVENLGRDLEIVRHAALHDALTALPNRALAVDRLEMALERRKR